MIRYLLVGYINDVVSSIDGSSSELEFFPSPSLTLVLVIPLGLVGGHDLVPPPALALVLDFPLGPAGGLLASTSFRESTVSTSPIVLFP